MAPAVKHVSWEKQLPPHNKKRKIKKSLPKRMSRLCFSKDRKAGDSFKIFIQEVFLSDQFEFIKSRFPAGTDGIFFHAVLDLLL